MRCADGGNARSSERRGSGSDPLIHRVTSRHSRINHETLLALPEELQESSQAPEVLLGFLPTEILQGEESVKTEEEAMSYEKDHELDHDYAGEAAFERWEREHRMEAGDDDYDERVESDGDDGDGPEDDVLPDDDEIDADPIGAARTIQERYLEQVSDAVDRILWEGRR
jgi:hypothetical protein